MPYPEPALNAFALALLGLCAATALGSSLTALVSEIHAWAARKAFAEKLSQHMARLGLVSGSVVLIVFAAWWVIVLRARGHDPAAPQDILALPALLGATACITLAIYVLSFMALRRIRVLRLLVAAMALAAMAGCVLSGTRLLLLMPVIVTGQGTAFPGTLLSTAPLFVLAQLALLAPGSGGVLGMVYLLTRRTRDDFGRDYYRWAVSRAAAWGTACPLVLAGTAALIASTFPRPLTGLLETPSLIVPLGLGVVLLLAVSGLCLTILRNQHPMRLKARMVLAACCLLAGTGLLTHAQLGPLAGL